MREGGRLDEKAVEPDGAINPRDPKIQYGQRKEGGRLDKKAVEHVAINPRSL